MAEAAIPRISTQELKRRMDAGEVLVYDVRKKEVFDRGHVKGARPLSVKEWATWAQEVPRDKSLVLY